MAKYTTTTSGDPLWDFVCAITGYILEFIDCIRDNPQQTRAWIGGLLAVGLGGLLTLRILDSKSKRPIAIIDINGNNNDELETVATTAIEQVEVIQPNLMSSVLRSDHSTPSPAASRHDLRRTSRTSRIPMAELQATASNPKFPVTPVVGISSPAASMMNTPTPTLARRSIENRISSSGSHTPFASAFSRHDFSMLERDAPETYATLRNTGMLNQDGTPTKKLLARENLPWNLVEGVKVDEEGGEEGDIDEVGNSDDLYE